nr:GFA family protein [Marinobacter panjinensis]
MSPQSAQTKLATREKHVNDTHQGGCLCGAVRYTATGQPKRVVVCHCASCQRRTGSGFAVEALFPEAQVNIEGELRQYRFVSDSSGRWLELNFCSQCGTNICLTLEVLPGARMLDAGTFDSPEWIDPRVHDFHYLFVRNAQCWSELPDDIQAYAQFYGD